MWGERTQRMSDGAVRLNLWWERNSEWDDVLKAKEGTMEERCIRALRGVMFDMVRDEPMLRKMYFNK